MVYRGESIMEINGFNIEPQNGSAGTDIPISTGISAINEGLDRSIEVNAICGNKSSALRITHEGMREKYITTDGEVYMTADNEIYGCLKQ